jgi:REP element-mobilizing transposase RayT
MQPRDISVRPFEWSDVRVRRGRLPHWEVDGGIYFVTFLLADSVPTAVIDRYREECEDVVERMEASPIEERWRFARELVRLYCSRIDRCLDTSLGASWFCKQEFASLMASVLRFHDRQRYDLFAWVVMPNHVHLVLRPLGESNLSQIMHTIKGYSAHELNEMAGRRGTFWQKEYFDHLVRSSLDLEKLCRYVIDNPRRASLQDWSWTWVCEELRASIVG